MSVTDLVGDITVEIGFGVDAVGGDYFVLDDPVKGELDNATYLLAPDTVFVDVTEHVASIETDRGRDRELDEYSTGKATVVFNDDDRTFDPAYDGSPYAGEIVPMKRIQVLWQTLPLFTGWVDDWSVVYEPGDSLSRVTASCIDGFGILANQELSTIAAAHSGDTSGERIERVLDRAEVDFPATRSIDDGNSTLGDTTFGENVLAYLQQCARAEAGYLFVATDGTLTFRNRQATLNVPSGATFSDNADDGIPYMVITQRSASDLLYTRVTGASETTSTEQAATNTAAANEFLIRTLPLGTLFNETDAEVLDLLEFHLERFSAPELRFQSATINLGACSEEQVSVVAGLDLTDVVTVERSPLSVGSMISRMSLVDGITHRITPGSWHVDLSFANADSRPFLILDDSVFGVLNANRLAF